MIFLKTCSKLIQHSGDQKRTPAKDSMKRCDHIHLFAIFGILRKKEKLRGERREI